MPAKFHGTRHSTANTRLQHSVHPRNTHTVTVSGITPAAFSAEPALLTFHRPFQVPQDGHNQQVSGWYGWCGVAGRQQGMDSMRGCVQREIELE